jgi:hypothetical protein
MIPVSIDSTGTPDAEAIHDLVTALDRDAKALGKDVASRCVRADVQALRAAIDGIGGTVASKLSALDTSVDRLHMSHMRPLFKQTLRTLRTALRMDVEYAMTPPAYEYRRRG